jgi:quercetin dioxygenase-like cupin family protein
MKIASEGVAELYRKRRAEEKDGCVESCEQRKVCGSEAGMKVLLLISSLGVLAMAQQSPVAPEKEPLHKTIFKNDYLLVLHVLIPPGKSTEFHTHSRDSVAIHLSETQMKIQEPGAEARGPNAMHPGDLFANNYTKHPYTHKVINAGDTIFDVLDIEALKRPNGPQAKPIGPVAAENASMRAYRYELAPGASSPQHTHERPYLIVSATAMELRMTAPDGQASTHPVKAGDLHWVDQEVTHTLTNAGKETGVIVEVELK